MNAIQTLKDGFDVLNAGDGSISNEPRFENGVNGVKSEPVSPTKRYTFGTYAKIEDIQDQYEEASKIQAQIDQEL